MILFCETLVLFQFILKKKEKGFCGYFDFTSDDKIFGFMSVFLEAISLFPCVPTPTPTPRMKVKTKSLPWWWLSGEESTCRCRGVIWFLVLEDPTRGAAQPVRHDYSACALAAGSRTHLGAHAAAAEAGAPRGRCSAAREAPGGRGLRREKPKHCNQTKACAAMRTQRSQK